MERLISNSIYCDYNSTSPLSESVKSFLESGDFLYANPSSTHQKGKKSKKVIREVTDYIKNLYQIENHPLNCVFHSGATEGINTLILGYVYHSLFQKKEKVTLFYSPTDHSCVISLLPLLEKMGVDNIELPINVHGELVLSDVIKLIKNCSTSKKLMTFTWVNNETGLVQDLSVAENIKKETGISVLVDAVQSPGKIKDWNQIVPDLDCYVFSAHKFGALKGIGFSFINENFKFTPLIIGGGQQDGLRSGTENITGIQSLKLAFEDLVNLTSEEDHFNFRDRILKDIEKTIHDHLKNRKYLVSEKLPHRNSNTICFVSPTVKANVLMMALDINGLEVSSGSACSSGASVPSRVLLSLGFSHEEAQGGIRLSFAPNISLAESAEIKKRLTVVLGKYYHI